MGLTLREVIKRLERMHAAPAAPPTTDPFELILWENAAYLVDDERRLETFERLASCIGTRPRDILASRRQALVEAIRPGGMHPEMRAEKLIRAATLADEVGVPLSKLVKGSPEDARRVLKRFPGIGEPGADKLLVFSGALAVLGLESNGLRVLVRLGFGPEHKDYARTWRQIRDRTADELGGDVSFARRAHLVLRHHGQTFCKRNAPECGSCVLASDCPVGRAAVS